MHNASILVALAEGYNEGIWGVKSPSQAFNFFKQAADLGDDEAQFKVFHCFRKGFEVEVSLTFANHYK